MSMQLRLHRPTPHASTRAMAGHPSQQPLAAQPAPVSEAEAAAVKQRMEANWGRSALGYHKVRFASLPPASSGCAPSCHRHQTRRHHWCCALVTGISGTSARHTLSTAHLAPACVSICTIPLLPLPAVQWMVENELWRGLNAAIVGELEPLLRGQAGAEVRRGARLALV